MPLMAAVEAGDLTAMEGGSAMVNSTMVFGISMAGPGSEGYMHRIGGVTAIPTPTTGITATIPTINITVTILAPAITGIPTMDITATIPARAITATIPAMATARSPRPARPGTIAPTPPAIIRMWHNATPAGCRFRRARAVSCHVASSHRITTAWVSSATDALVCGGTLETAP